MKINKTYYKLLQKYETYFRQAHYGSYLMNCSSKVTLEVVDIAKKCGYVGSVNVSCNSCKIKFFKEVAKVYFEYQKSIDKKGEN